eukprot:XP_016663618.1 PREDICTED: uncharacterized protein LOC100575322 isoform X2 [Acyrthosiphon pisum]
MKTIPLLTETMMMELIPSVGHRARLKSNIDQWKNIIQQIPSPSPASCSSIDTDIQITNLIQNNVWSESSSSNVDKLPADIIKSNIWTEASSSGTSSAEKSPEEITQNSVSEILELLKTTNEGKSLLSTFHQNGLLDSAGRRRLCHLIINRELRDDVQRRIPSSRLHNLAYQITKVFQNERASTYFIPYISYGPGLKRAAKGKLLDCLNNRRREYRKAGLINSSRRSSTSSESSFNSIPLPEGLVQLTEEEGNYIESVVEENLNWLRNSSDPWDLVEINWNLTSSYRLKRLMSQDGPSIAEYMTEFPCLKKPAGYLLILKDFNVAYPKSVDKLYQNLPIYRKKIIDLTLTRTKKTKDSTVHQILNEYLQYNSDDEETSNIVCLFCLVFLVGNSVVRGKKSTSQWKPSKLEARDGFITKVSSDAEVQETIGRRREKLSSLGHTLQPFIIIVGQSYHHIQNYLVIVDNTIYKLHSITAAVDCCFKIFLTLNAEYPVESTGIWYFIQKGFYQIKTPWDKNYTTVSALLSDIGIPIMQGE